MLQKNFTRLSSKVLDKSVLDNINANTDSSTAIGEALNAALKSKLSNALKENGYIVLASLFQNMDLVISPPIRRCRSGHLWQNRHNAEQA